jgi:penicillin-binding protein 1B
MAKSRKRKKKSKTKESSFLKKGAPWVIIFALFFFFTWLGYLDYTVQRQFEGKRWSLPAKVYASSKELYVGAELTKKALISQLEQLRYRQRNSLQQPANYRVRSASIDLYLRDFQFWDGRRSPQKVRVSFAGGVVSSILELPIGKTVSLLRLDPQLIGNFYPKHKEDRVLLKLNQVPKSLIEALLLIEDRDFYDHFGLSPKGILRALWANIRSGKVVQGGSTLTQQLVKNFFLTSERSLGRKITEALMALLVEFHYEKDEILEAYLNEIYLGQEGSRAIHGFGLASEYYFSQKIEKLSLHQSALLVALVRGPSYYHPEKHQKRALARRNRILASMQEASLISVKEYRTATGQKTDVTRSKKHPDRLFPAFMGLVKRQLLQEYRNEDLTSEGLRIFTTLDPLVQRETEAVVTKRLPQLESRKKLAKGSLQTAVIVTRREGGEVVAMIGGARVKYAGFNRALDAVRPIGSLIKPVTYLTALADGKYTAASLLDDWAISLKNRDGSFWSPRNYDKIEHGEVPLYIALTHSYNLASVRLGLNVGLDKVLNRVKTMGVRRPLKSFPSALLGASALTPFEVTQLYQSFAGDCFVTPLRSIQAVLSNKSEPLQRYPLTVRQAADPAACYIINSIMQEVMQEGTGRSAYRWLPRDMNLVGKTGTTNELRDSWFAGYSGDYLSVVWVGRDDNKPTKLTGASGALPVWSELMGEISRQPVGLIQPENIEIFWIDPANGMLADEQCVGARPLPFVKGTEPSEYSPCTLPVNKIKSWFGRVLESH